MAGSPIDANAFLDQDAFATLLGTDDEIDLPAGFFERALTLLHAKGYGLLARKAEKHDDRYIRRLRQGAWNFDYSDTVGDPRAELGLRDTNTPLGKLYIPAKSVKIGTGGAVAAPTVGRHGVSAATAWERLGELTAAAGDTKRNKAVRAIVAQLTARGVAITDRIDKAISISDIAGMSIPRIGDNDDNVLDRLETTDLPSPVPLMTFTRNTGGVSSLWYRLMCRMPFPTYEDLNILSTYTDAIQMLFHRLGTPSLWEVIDREVDMEDDEAVAIDFTLSTGLGPNALIHVRRSEHDFAPYTIDARKSSIGDYSLEDLYETADEVGKFDNLDEVTAEDIAEVLAYIGPEMDVTETRLYSVAEYAAQLAKPPKVDKTPFYKLIDDIIVMNDIEESILLDTIAMMTSEDYGYMLDIPEEPQKPRKR
jgi:hypothetical protein